LIGDYVLQSPRYIRELSRDGLFVDLKMEFLTQNRGAIQKSKKLFSIAMKSRGKTEGAYGNGLHGGRFCLQLDYSCSDVAPPQLEFTQNINQFFPLLREIGF